MTSWYVARNTAVVTALAAYVLHTAAWTVAAGTTASTPLEVLAALCVLLFCVSLLRLAGRH